MVVDVGQLEGVDDTVGAHGYYTGCGSSTCSYVVRI